MSKACVLAIMHCSSNETAVNVCWMQK